MDKEIDIPYEQGQTQILAIDAKKNPPPKYEGIEKVHTIGREGAEERDDKYTDLMELYIANYDDNKREIKEYRKKYFTVSIAVLVSLAILGLVLIVSLFFVDFGTVGSIIAAITAFASIVGSMLAIPITITKHLFPQELDHEIVDIVKCMIENDCEIRRIDSKTECLSCKNGENANNYFKRGE